jgi:hypothetical protein
VRYLAHRYAANVCGIELTPSRVVGAQELTKLVGLGANPDHINESGNQGREWPSGRAEQPDKVVTGVAIDLQCCEAIAAKGKMLEDID